MTPRDLEDGFDQLTAPERDDAEPLPPLHPRRRSSDRYVPAGDDGMGRISEFDLAIESIRDFGFIPAKVWAQLSERTQQTFERYSPDSEGVFHVVE